MDEQNVDQELTQQRNENPDVLTSEDALTPKEQSTLYNDPVIKFLNKLQFKDRLIEQLMESESNPETYEKIFKFPDILVYWNAYNVLSGFAPDVDSEDNIAFMNLIRWLMIKMATHPYWFQRIGWFNRFVAGHTNPTSYYPITYSPFFIPKFWKPVTGDWDKKIINDDLKKQHTFDEVYDWKTNDKRFEDLERMVGLDWIEQKVKEKRGN